MKLPPKMMWGRLYCCAHLQSGMEGKGGEEMIVVVVVVCAVLLGALAAAHMHAIWPILFETIRSSDKATSCARNRPHIATDAALASAHLTNPMTVTRCFTPGIELTMVSIISQKPSS